MSDKTRNSIAYLCWMLAAFAFLMFMGPAVKGATKEIRVPTFIPADQQRQIHYVDGVAVDSTIALPADSSASGDSINWIWTVTYDSTKANAWLFLTTYHNESQEVSDWFFHSPIGNVIEDTTTAGNIIARQIDSLIYQGAASGLSIAQIVFSVDSALTANHNAGSWTTGGSGSGPNAQVIFPIDTLAEPDDTLSGILVSVYNLTGSPEAGDISDNTGAATVNLSAGTWLVRAALNSSRFIFDDTNLVNVTPFDTSAILGYAFVPAVPVDPEVALVWGFVRDFLNQPVQGMIVEMQNKVSINVGTSAPGFIQGGHIAYDTTDASGFFSFEALRSMEYSDSTKNRYKVTGKTAPDKRIKFTVDTLYVPDTGSVDITNQVNGM